MTNSADGSKINAKFSGVGSATKFRGLGGSNVVSSLSNRVADSGNTITGLNGVALRVTDQSDPNGDNALRYNSEYELPYFRPGQAQAGDTVGFLPVPRKSQARIVGVRIRARVAPSGNSSGGWTLGFVKGGATFASRTITLPDGATSHFEEIDYRIPAGWMNSGGNIIAWRGSPGTTVNDGTGPEDVHVMLTWFPG